MVISVVVKGETVMEFVIPKQYKTNAMDFRYRVQWMFPGATLKGRMVR